MGMYTQLHYGVRLKKNTPQQVVDLLQFMLGDEAKKPTELPDHDLFRTSRWSYMLTCDSYYFNYKTCSNMRLDDIAGQWFFSVTCNVKNYNNEIEKFIDWLMPYVEAMEGDFLGYSRYEETETPTIIYYSKGV